MCREMGWLAGVRHRPAGLAPVVALHAPEAAPVDHAHRRVRSALEDDLVGATRLGAGWLGAHEAVRLPGKFGV